MTKEDVVNKVMYMTAEQLLPQNLSQDLLDYMLGEMNLMWCGKSSEIPVLLFVAMKVLHPALKPNSNKGTSPEELAFCVGKYAISLALEDITRKTDITFEPPTLDNIFAEREIRVWRGCQRLQ